MAKITRSSKVCPEQKEKLIIPGNTAVKRRLLNTAVDIQENDTTEIEFMQSVFCAVSLPRKKVSGRIFQRTNGNTTLTLEAGALYNGRETIEQPLPYGPKPRLLLIHACGEALRHGTRIVEVGKSLTAFAKRLGFTATGGKKGSIANFRQQIKSLAACHMRINRISDGVLTSKRIDILDGFASWEEKNGLERFPWPGVIELTESFYASLKGNCVPLDPRAIGALSHSSLALDIYLWLTQRLPRLRRPTKLTWETLHGQLGHEYRLLKDFRRCFLISLGDALLAYPAAKVEIVRGGLMLRNSPPPIKRVMIST